MCTFFPITFQIAVKSALKQVIVLIKIHILDFFLFAGRWTCNWGEGGGGSLSAGVYSNIIAQKPNPLVPYISSTFLGDTFQPCI